VGAGGWLIALDAEGKKVGRESIDHPLVDESPEPPAPTP
jgi:hypothetical protein